MTAQRQVRPEGGGTTAGADPAELIGRGAEIRVQPGAAHGQ